MSDKKTPPPDIAEALSKSLNQMTDIMNGDSDVCFHCQRKIKSLEQVGRSVYARPCGCRLWQGKVPDEWRKRTGG